MYTHKSLEPTSCLKSDWMPSRTTLAACDAVSETTEYSAIANIAPAVFHRGQFRGSAALSDGTGSFRVLPVFVMRNVLPDRL